MTRAIILIFALCFLIQIHAKIFSECELVEELRRQGFPEDQINGWTCLTKYESGRNTQAFNTDNVDGSQDLGLFQINDRLWCSNGDSPGKGCNVRCKDLLLDDITAASQCAKTIFAENARLFGNGFEEWTTWKQHCQGINLPLC